MVDRNEFENCPDDLNEVFHQVDLGANVTIDDVHGIEGDIFLGRISVFGPSLDGDLYL